MDHNVFTLGFSYAYGADFEGFLAFDENYPIKHFEDFNDLYAEMKDLETKVIIFIALEADYNYDLNSIFGFNVNKFPNVEVVFCPDKLNDHIQLYYNANGITNIIYGPTLMTDIAYTTYTLLNTRPMVIEDCNFKIDLLNRTIKYNDKLIKTTDSVYAAIIHFVSNPGKIVSHDEIIQELCSFKHSLTNEPVTKLIERVRKATDKSLFKNVRGKGYVYGEKKIIADPTVIEFNQEVRFLCPAPIKEIPDFELLFEEVNDATIYEEQEQANSEYFDKIFEEHRSKLREKYLK